MSPEERASDPDTAPGVLGVLAGRFPEAVLANPALALLALTQPGPWCDIVGRARAALATRRLRALHAEASEEALARWQRGAVRHVLPLCDDETRGRLTSALDALDAGVDAEAALELLASLGAWWSSGQVDDQAPGMLVITATQHLLANEGAQAPDMCVEASRREAEQRGGSAWYARALEMEWQADSLAALLGR